MHSHPSWSRWAAFLLILLCFRIQRAGLAANAGSWSGLQYVATGPADPMAGRGTWEGRQVQYIQSQLSPGVLVRMRSRSISFFTELEKYGAEPPTLFWVMTKAGARAVGRGQTVRGSEMTASWIVTSFQGASGWDRFDVPWFIALDRRPTLVALGANGLRLSFEAPDTGYIFSMPLFGYYKPPQAGTDFAARHGLPSAGIETWKWKSGLPKEIVARCDWWAAAAKAYPVGFQESFSVAPESDEITFRQDYRWLRIADAWGTVPRRFASLSPAVSLAWKYPGFPMRISGPVHDPDYFTAYGPFAGVLDADRVEIAMPVLRYLNELESPRVSGVPSPAERRALALISAGARSKFATPWRFDYDHGGRENLCWNLAADVWYARAFPYLPLDARNAASKALRTYVRNDVLRPHSPYHGKYLLHGPGIGSWGESGDAGKFMTTALQAIWGYGQFTGDWATLRERWDLIRRFFLTADEADWLGYGRYGIAEIGDEAAPCSAYARIAWALGDRDEYLLGAYMFARELVHLYIKQRAGAYFYGHQPYNQYSPMPARLYPTDLWGTTRGWQVDGPSWTHLSSGEHQSANRWVRFHDPDVGRFYRDHLAADVAGELEWYARVARENSSEVYRLEAYQQALRRDNTHILPSFLRLESLLLGRAPDLASLPASTGWGAADIAMGYSALRTSVPLDYKRLVAKTEPASPFVIGLERRGPDTNLTTVQDIRDMGARLEPRWHGWGRDGGYLSFGSIQGDFPGTVTGEQGSEWLSYGCRVTWADTVRPRTQVPSSGSKGAPIAVIGPFPNFTDSELTTAVYPPETRIEPGASYPGAFGPVKWRATTLTDGARADLRRELSSPDGSGTLAYVLQYVDSPEDVKAYLLVKHQGGLVAWVNGERVYSEHGVHKPRQEESLSAVAHLRKGRNTVLLKVESFTGQYDFQFRLVHVDRRPIPGLTVSAHIPNGGDGSASRHGGRPAPVNTARHGMASHN